MYGTSRNTAFELILTVFMWMLCDFISSILSSSSAAADSATATTPIVCSVLSAGVVAMLVSFVWKKNKFFKRNVDELSNSKSNAGDIPWAPGAMPILGHALAYKKDPPGFLRKCERAVGPIFRLNLAGQRLILVTGGSDDGGKRFAQWMARQPDGKLSLTKAVVEYGFLHTLGSRNVYEGTEFHKAVIRERINTNLNDLIAQTRHAMANAMNVELASLLKANNEGKKKNIDKSNNANNQRIPIEDLFTFTRKVMIRTVLACLVGSCVLVDNKKHGGDDEEDDVLILDMLTLLDQIEDATAATAVLPSWLARILFLQPTEKARLALQQKLQTRLLETSDNVRRSTWLHAMQEKQIDCPAEFIIGLCFAAAKNPSLGAAQSLCYFLDQQHDKNQDKSDGDVSNIAFREAIRNETTAWMSFSAQITTWEQLQSSCRHGMACIREATRLTALSIGSLRRVLGPLQFTDNETGRTISLVPGETIAMSLYLPNTDPQQWDRPDTFHPQRFLKKSSSSSSSNNTTNSSKTTPTLLTFSQGTHHCPGERIAMVFMHAFLTAMVDRDVQLLHPRRPLPPLSWERATVAQRKGPVLVTVQCRDTNEPETDTQLMWHR